MADKAISELVAAEQITATDMFVLEQNGTAKKLTGQVLLNWLVKAADGHGGISDIAKVSTSGLADTYRITLADTTTFDFIVTNGKGISSIAKTSTSGLVDTYTIRYNDNTTSTFTVTNGAKGNPGDTAYVWIKYASQEPTASSHSFGDVPDDWIGVYFGFSSTAPTNWQEYRWYKIKGEQGNTGNPATLVSSAVAYQVGDSGTIIPSGTWSASVPAVTQGKYLWTRVTQTYNTGTPIVSYSVSRMGLDGTGSVSSVCGVPPNPDGNVPLSADDVSALPLSGGVMTGALNMNGQKITGLNNPTGNSDAANKGYVDTKLALGGGTMTGAIAMGGNKITGLGTPSASSDAVTVDYLGTSLNNAFKTAHRTATATLTVAGWSNLQQTVSVSNVTASKVVIVSPEAASYAAYTEANVRCIAQGTSTLTFACDEVPTSALTVNVLVITLS